MHGHSVPVKVGPVETLNGTVYMYSVDGYLSKDTYHNSASAWHDARKPQAFAPGRLVGPARIMPTERHPAYLEPHRR